MFQTQAEAEFLASILREQPYIRNLTISDKECIPAPDVTNYINLDLFRELPEPYGLSEIRNWVYRLSSLKPDSFARPVLTVPPSDIPVMDKIAINFTNRYKPIIDPKVLKKYASKLVYIGMPREYDRFKTLYFKCEYHKTNSLKELLQYTSKCHGWISNVCGTFAAHEAAAIPRVLCLPGGAHGDVRTYTPNGISVVDNRKLIKAVESLLSRDPLA